MKRLLASIFSNFAELLLKNIQNKLQLYLGRLSISKKAATVSYTALFTDTYFKT